MDTKGLVSFDGNCAGYIRPLGDDQPAIARVYALADLHRFVACWNAMVDLNPDAVADVVAAAEALIQNRDKNCFDREEYKQGGKYGDYWSPAASMVNSEHVAALRTALARIRGEG